jgi:hypothetical protein
MIKPIVAVGTRASVMSSGIKEGLIMHRSNRFVLALAVALTLSTQAYAQAPDTRRDAPDAPPRADRSDDRDWGWLGLLGLAGLFGLMRRERAPAVRDRVATGTAR